MVASSQKDSLSNLSPVTPAGNRKDVPQIVSKWTVVCVAKQWHRNIGAMGESQLAGWARFCSVFAVFGVVFLFIVGYLLQSQPLYIKGPEDKAAAATACYQGAGLYLVVWIASIAYSRINTAGESVPETSGGRAGAYGSISTREN